MAINVILDTDIGTDVDDCLALALILASPELALKGVTCVYGDVDLRARMTTKLLELHHQAAIPVMAGERTPLLNKRQIYWGGHEGKGLLTDEDSSLTYSPESAVDFIVRLAHEQSGQIHLIGIAPLTTIAAVLRRDPKLPLAGITLMGGVIRGPGRLDLPYAEHNIVCDPEAAHIVLSSGLPITLIPLDLTTQVRVTVEGLRRIRAGGTAFHEAVANQLAVYPYFQQRNWTYLHDPLAVATVIDPSLVQMQRVHVDVELAGQYSAGMTLMRADDNSPIQVGVSVDVARFEEFFVSRLEKDLV